MTEWQSIRLFVLASQEGTCADGECSAPATDVVSDASGDHVAYCRSHRLRRDGHARAIKAIHTKLVRRERESGQTTILP
jgi:hypothetical protein